MLRHPNNSETFIAFGNNLICVIFVYLSVTSKQALFPEPAGPTIIIPCLSLRIYLSSDTFYYNILVTIKLLKSSLSTDLIS